jgi:pectate lyase
VVASPTPAAVLYAHDFTASGGPTDLWAFTGTGLWRTVSSGSNSVFAQSSVAGVARASIGVSTDDQSVDVRARPTTFAGTGNGERWFGVMARYVDDSNYYYLTLRSTNSASLRKLTNGVITELGNYSLPVSVGNWYALRIEAVGSQIRGYVNGFLVAEATDTTHPRGSAGPISNRAAVDFDDYRAIQP